MRCADCGGRGHVAENCWLRQMEKYFMTESGYRKFISGLWVDPTMMGGWPYTKSCKSCGDPIGPTSWFDYCGPCMGKANTPAVEPAVKMQTDAEMDEEIIEELKGWDRERQLAVYKWLNMKFGIRIGGSLDHELKELRYRRRNP